MKEATFKEIAANEEQIDAIAKTNQVKEWKFFDHVIQGKRFPQRAPAYMLVSTTENMNRTHWNEFNLRVNLLFNDFNIEMYTVETLEALVQEQKLTSELFAEIIKNAKAIKELSISDSEKKVYKTSDTTLFSSSNKKQPVIPQEIIEMFKGAFELLDLSDINEPQRKILISLLKDPSYTPEKIVLFAKELSVSVLLASSIDILYCALHPDKWDNTSFTEHKRNLLDNTAQFALPLKASAEELRQIIEQLKIIAKLTVNELYKEKIVLNEEENVIKNKIIQKVNNTLSTERPKTVLSPISQKILAKGIIDDYLEPYYNEHCSESESMSDSSESPREEDDLQELELKLKDLAIQEPLCNKWKLLNRFSETWKNIYSLVKFSKNNHRQREEGYMFEIIKAILYHEEKQCSWKSLPQDFISGGKAYYYKRAWEQEGILKKIITLATNMPTPETLRPIF